VTEMKSSWTPEEGVNRAKLLSHLAMTVQCLEMMEERVNLDDYSTIRAWAREGRQLLSRATTNNVDQNDGPFD